MDFFKEFGKQFTSVARSVTEKTKESAETGKLGSELRSAREGLERLYARYGKACYALQNGRGNRDEVAELTLRIRAEEARIGELDAAWVAAREVKRCLSCGAVFPKEARFCSACGKRLPEEAPRPEPVAVGEYCPACGAAREDGEVRCPVCGADFEPRAAASEPAPEPAPVPEGPDIEEPDGAMEE